MLCQQQGSSVSIAHGDLAAGCTGLRGRWLGRSSCVAALGMAVALSWASAATATWQQVRSVLGEKSLDNFGIAVAGAGDLNGDGFDDQIIGAYLHEEPGFSNSGRVYVLSGADGSFLYTFDGVASGDQFGHRVAAGDVDGDGVNDVIIAARLQDSNGTNSGRVYVFDGATGATMAILTLDGDVAGAEFGLGIAAEDMNGDGRADIIVGSRLHDSPGLTNNGKVHVYSGASTTAVPVLLFSVEGEGTGDLFGFAVTGLGDVNGDGLGDIAVGAIRHDGPNGVDSGKVYVYAGGTTGADLPAAAAALYTLDGDAASDDFGVAVAGAGDVDGDGAGDIIIGAQRAFSGRGRVYVHSGATGSPRLFTFTGDAPGGINVGHRLGVTVAGGGDTNCDGVPDIIAGGGELNFRRGRIKVFSGADGLTLLSQDGETTSSFFGVVGNAGDVDGDGRADVIVGANIQGTTNGGNSGKIFIFADNLNNAPCVTNQPPAANAGPDQSVECAGAGGAAVTLDGSASSDPDGVADIADYEWSEGATVLAAGPSATALVNLADGSHTITLVVTDTAGQTSTDTVLVTVQDTTGPVISCALARMGEGDNEGDAWDDSDEGDFRVDVSVSDLCDAAPAVDIVLVAIGPDGVACGEVSLGNGQEVELELEDDNCEIETEWKKKKGVFEVEIEATQMILRVTATDAAGNVSVCEATPQGLAFDNDDDHDVNEGDD